MIDKIKKAITGDSDTTQLVSDLTRQLQDTGCLVEEQRGLFDGNVTYVVDGQRFYNVEDFTAGAERILSGQSILHAKNPATLLVVPVEDVYPNPHQPRRIFNEESLNVLAENITANGLIQPIVVEITGDGYQLIDGERRWRAHVIAGLNEIAAVVSDPPPDETAARERSVKAFVANAQREDLNPVDEALAIRGMLDLGMDNTEIATALGMSQSAISNKKRLLTLPDEILQALADGQITERHAMRLAPVYSWPPAVLQAVEESVYSLDMIVANAKNGQPSTVIANQVDSLATSISRTIPDEWYGEPFEGEYVSTSCAGCPNKFSHKKQKLCIDRDCFARKKWQYQTDLIREASIAVGLPVVPFGASTSGFHSEDGKRVGLRMLNEGCEHGALAVKYTGHEFGLVLTEQGYPNCQLVCTSRGGGYLGCPCIERIKVEETPEPEPEPEPEMEVIKQKDGLWEIKVGKGKVQLSRKDIVELVRLVQEEKEGEHV